MQIQAVNRHAVRKYEEFQSAIELVRIALDEAAKFVKKIGPPADDRFGGWQMPEKEDVEKNLKKSREALNTLYANAKKHEKELTAKGWMV